MNKLKIHSDQRGNLAAINFNQVPFIPKRIFWVYGSDCIRGNHAHKECDQLLICVHGNIEVTTKERLHADIEFITKERTLLSEGDVLYVPKMTWEEIRFYYKTDVLLVLASTEYDEKDYIRDWDNFLNLANGSK